MNADKQEELYEKYWLSIEKALKSGTDYTNLNLFLCNMSFTKPAHR